MICKCVACRLYILINQSSFVFIQLNGFKLEDLDYPNYNITKITQNTEESPGDLVLLRLQ